MKKKKSKMWKQKAGDWGGGKSPHKLLISEKGNNLTTENPGDRCSELRQSATVQIDILGEQHFCAITAREIFLNLIK